MLEEQFEKIIKIHFDTYDTNNTGKINEEQLYALIDKISDETKLVNLNNKQHKEISSTLSETLNCSDDEILLSKDEQLSNMSIIINEQTTHTITKIQYFIKDNFTICDNNSKGYQKNNEFINLIYGLTLEQNIKEMIKRQHMKTIITIINKKNEKKTTFKNMEENYKNIFYIQYYRGSKKQIKNFDFQKDTTLNQSNKKNSDSNLEPGKNTPTKSNSFIRNLGLKLSMATAVLQVPEKNKRKDSRKQSIYSMINIQPENVDSKSNFDLSKREIKTNLSESEKSDFSDMVVAKNIEYISRDPAKNFKIIVNKNSKKHWDIREMKGKNTYSSQRNINNSLAQDDIQDSKSVNIDNSNSKNKQKEQNKTDREITYKSSNLQIHKKINKADQKSLILNENMFKKDEIMETVSDHEESPLKSNLPAFNKIVSFQQLNSLEKGIIENKEFNFPNNEVRNNSGVNSAKLKKNKTYTKLTIDVQNDNAVEEFKKEEKPNSLQELLKNIDDEDGNNSPIKLGQKKILTEKNKDQQKKEKSKKLDFIKEFEPIKQKKTQSNTPQLNTKLIKKLEKIFDSTGFDTQNPELLDYFTDLSEFEIFVNQSGLEIEKLVKILEKIKFFFITSQNYIAQIMKVWKKNFSSENDQKDRQKYFDILSTISKYLENKKVMAQDTISLKTEMPFLRSMGDLLKLLKSDDKASTKKGHASNNPSIDQKNPRNLILKYSEQELKRQKLAKNSLKNLGKLTATFTSEGSKAIPDIKDNKNVNIPIQEKGNDFKATNQEKATGLDISGLNSPKKVLLIKNQPLNSYTAYNSFKCLKKIDSNLSNQVNAMNQSVEENISQKFFADTFINFNSPKGGKQALTKDPNYPDDASDFYMRHLNKDPGNSKRSQKNLVAPIHVIENIIRDHNTKRTNFKDISLNNIAHKRCESTNFFMNQGYKAPIVSSIQNKLKQGSFTTTKFYKPNSFTSDAEKSRMAEGSMLKPWESEELNPVQLKRRNLQLKVNDNFMYKYGKVNSVSKQNITYSGNIDHSISPKRNEKSLNKKAPYLLGEEIRRDENFKAEYKKKVDQQS